MRKRPWFSIPASKKRFLSPLFLHNPYRGSVYVRVVTQQGCLMQSYNKKMVLSGAGDDVTPMNNENKRKILVQVVLYNNRDKDKAPCISRLLALHRNPRFELVQQTLIQEQHAAALDECPDTARSYATEPSAQALGAVNDLEALDD